MNEREYVGYNDFNVSDSKTQLTTTSILVCESIEVHRLIEGYSFSSKLISYGHKGEKRNEYLRLEEFSQIWREDQTSQLHLNERGRRVYKEFRRGYPLQS